MSEDTAQGPVKSWQVGHYRINLELTRRIGKYRWGAERGGKGVGGHLTPFGALLHLRKWRNEKSVPE